MVSLGPNPFTKCSTSSSIRNWIVNCLLKFIYFILKSALRLQTDCFRSSVTFDIKSLTGQTPWSVCHCKLFRFHLIYTLASIAELQNQYHQRPVRASLHFKTFVIWVVNLNIFFSPVCRGLSKSTSEENIGPSTSTDHLGLNVCHYGKTKNNWSQHLFLFTSSCFQLSSGKAVPICWKSTAAQTAPCHPK